MLVYLFCSLILYLFGIVSCQGSCEFVDKDGNSITSITFNMTEKRPINESAGSLYVKHVGADPNDVKVNFGRGEVSNCFELNKIFNSSTNVSEFTLNLKMFIDLSTTEGKNYKSIMDFDVQCEPNANSKLELEIEFLDVNDPPVFNYQSFVYNLTENFPVDLEFTKLFYPNIFAWDLDSNPDFAKLDFLVVENSGSAQSQIFGVKNEILPGQISTTNVFNYSVNLFLKQKLHFATTSSHSFILMAKDTSSDPVNTTIPITVDVIPNLVSVSTPKFNSPIYKSQILIHNKSVEQPVPFNLSMTPDEILATISDNFTLIYEIDPRRSDCPQCFQLLDRSIKLVDAQDLITANTHHAVLTIVAFPSGSRDRYDVARVDIEIVHKPLFSEEKQSVFISRDTKNDSLIWVANAGSFARYEIKNVISSAISYDLDEETGELRVIGSLIDAENVTFSIGAFVNTENGTKIEGGLCELRVGIFDIQLDFECSVNETEENVICDGVEFIRHQGYEILYGNDDGYFEMLDTGKLNITESLDFEEKSGHRLTVRRTPPGVVYNIKVNVQDVNEPPKITKIENVIGIAPWTQFGQILTTIKAEDPDFGVNGEIVYGIKNNPQDFLINSLTGEFYHLQKITTQVTTLKILATDKGTPPKFDEKTLKVCILDADEIFQLIVHQSSIIEISLTTNNLTTLFNVSDVGFLSWADDLTSSRSRRYSLFAVKNDKILKFDDVFKLATDKQTELSGIFGVYEIQPYSEISGNQICSVFENEENVFCDGLNLKPYDGYKIISGNDGGFFEILNTGHLNITTALDFEKQLVYTLTIQKLHSDESFNISVIVVDVNEAPLITNKTTIIGVAPWNQFGQILTTIEAEDPDFGVNGEIVYGIKNNPQDFSINSLTGEFYHQQKPTTQVTSLKILATDKGTPPKFDEKTFTVCILDADEIFQLIVHQTSIMEISLITNNLTTLFNVADVGFLSWEDDLTTSGSKRYSLFAVKNDKILKFDDVFKLATDKQTELTDIFGVYEIQPYSEISGGHTCSVSENEVNVFCDGLNLKPYPGYKIISGNDRDNFQILTTGQLKVTTALDFEKQPFYTLTIQKSHSDESFNISVIVVDINEAPVITNKTTILGVAPWNQFGQILTTIKAEDVDSGKNGEIYYEITNNGDYFSIDQLTGELYYSKKPKAEVSNISITISATDGGIPSKSDEKTFQIYFVDINKIFQIITSPNVKSTIIVNDLIDELKIDVGLLSWENENNQDTKTAHSFFAVENGNILEYESVEKFVASSFDELKIRFGEFAMRPYTEKNINFQCSIFENTENVLCNGLQLIPHSRYKIIKGTKDGIFEMEKTGQLKVIKSLNFEEQQQYNLTIQRSLSEIEVVVNVIDVNEPPNITYIETPIYVAPWIQSGKIALNIKAEDPDFGLNGEFYYQIDTKTDDFVVNPESGELHLLQNRNEINLELQISVIDKGFPANNDTKTTRIYFLAADEIFQLNVKQLESDIAPLNFVKNLSILLNRNIRFLKHEVESTQIRFKRSSLQNKKVIKYSLFALENDTVIKYPEIYKLINDSLDELKNLSGVVNVEPYIEDKKEYACSVEENLENVICDGIQLGQQSGYKIFSGDEDGHFEITENGELNITKPLDFELKSTYSLQIERPHSVIIIEVKVVDVNEPPKITSFDPILGFAPWNQLGQSLLTFKAEDPDSGENGKINFNLSSPDDINKYFYISPSTGELYLLQKPQEKMIALNIYVIDGGLPTKSDMKTAKVYFLDRDEIFHFSVTSSETERGIDKAKKIAFDLSKMLDLDVGLLYWEKELTKNSTLNCSLFAAKDSKPLKFQSVDDLMTKSKEELNKVYGELNFQPHIDPKSPKDEVKTSDDNNDDDKELDKSTIIIIALSIALALLVIIFSLKLLCARFKRGDKDSDTSQLLRKDLGIVESNRESERQSQASSEHNSEIEVDNAQIEINREEIETNKAENDNSKMETDKAETEIVTSEIEAVKPEIETDKAEIEIKNPEIEEEKIKPINEEIVKISPLIAEMTKKGFKPGKTNEITQKTPNLSPEKPVVAEKPKMPKEDYDLTEPTTEEKPEITTSRLVKPDMPPKDYQTSDDEDDDTENQPRTNIVKFNEKPEIIETETKSYNESDTENDTSSPRRQSIVTFNDSPEVILDTVDL